MTIPINRLCSLPLTCSRHCFNTTKAPIFFPSLFGRSYWTYSPFHWYKILNSFSCRPYTEIWGQRFQRSCLLAYLFFPLAIWYAISIHFFPLKFLCGSLWDVFFTPCLLLRKNLQSFQSPEPATNICTLFCFSLLSCNSEWAFRSSLTRVSFPTPLHWKNTWKSGTLWCATGLVLVSFVFRRWSYGYRIDGRVFPSWLLSPLGPLPVLCLVAGQNVVLSWSKFFVVLTFLLQLFFNFVPFYTFTHSSFPACQMICTLVFPDRTTFCVGVPAPFTMHTLGYLKKWLVFFFFCFFLHFTLFFSGAYPKFAPFSVSGNPPFPTEPVRRIFVLS